MHTAGLSRARWQVKWVSEKRIHTVECGDDLAEALRLYTLAQKGGRHDVTLRSKNVAIAPPQRLRPVEHTNTKGEVVRITVPLEHYNARGWLWCPFCIQLRKFRLQRGFHAEGQWVPEAGYHCPMCGISHRDASVRRWNPVAERYYVEGVRAPRR